MVKKIQAFKPSNAEKAFVYQQTQDLASYLNETSEVSVLLEKIVNFPSIDSIKVKKIAQNNLKKGKNSYAVTFILGTAPFNILARSEGKNFLETCISAKNRMKKKLSKLANSVEESKERSQFIEKVKKNPYLH